MNTGIEERKWSHWEQNVSSDQSGELETWSSAIDNLTGGSKDEDHSLVVCMKSSEDGWATQCCSPLSTILLFSPLSPDFHLHHNSPTRSRGGIPQWKMLIIFSPSPGFHWRPWVFRLPTDPSGEHQARLPQSCIHWADQTPPPAFLPRDKLLPPLTSRTPLFLTGKLLANPYYWCPTQTCPREEWVGNPIQGEGM